MLADPEQSRKKLAKVPEQCFWLLAADNVEGDA
jgi:hypothetical protein